MKLRNLALAGLNLALIAALTLMTIGCSGDDNSSTGPSASPGAGVTYDEITVSLNRLTATYDCDYDPVGITSPGDFRYTINIDTLDADGNWAAITKYGEASKSVNTGSYANITGRTASFRFPRINGQSFRVRLSLREVDGSDNDFSSSTSVIHSYSASSTQMYAPQGTNYASWDNAREVGTMNWNVNKRDRTWVLGVLTVEGCNATLSYSVTVRQVD